MRKKLFFLVLFIVIFSGFAAADIMYEIDAGREEIMMNSTVEMSCDPEDSNCPVNVWTLTLNKPENSTVIDVESSLGEVEQYDVRGDRITIETSSDEARESVAIRVSYRIAEEATQVGNGLYHRQIGLPGFRGERNYGEIRSEDILHADVSYGFDSSLQGDLFQFSGEGPANANFNFGEGYETEYYEFFGGRPDNTESAYEISVGVLGFAHRFERLPTVILDGRKYNESVNRWSRGQYTQGRLIMREGLENDFNPILAHETVHALNDERLEWDRTDSSYFDEGVSKYIESLVRESEADHPTRELFGDEVTYEQEKNGDRYRYTLPSKGDKEQLWEYYQNDLESMKSWNAKSESRAFGYAYSELIIRNYIANQDGSVRELYSKLNKDSQVESAQEKWDYYSNFLDMTPCKYNSREVFEECLETVNEYDYPIYTAQPQSRTSGSLDIDKIELSKETKSPDTEEQQTDEKVASNENLSDGESVDIIQNSTEKLKSPETDNEDESKTSLLKRLINSLRNFLSDVLYI